MSRTLGAKDKKKRRKHKKKKFYKPFPKLPRGHKSTIKVALFQEKPMTLEGYRQFSRETRKFMRRVTFNYVDKAEINPEIISSKIKIGEFIRDWVGSEGIFILRGYSKGKTRFGVKQVRLARVTLRELKGEVTPINIELADRKGVSRVNRYWWWRG